ncbi:SDR family oxidoreductase [Kutzneria albida]|uniref:Short chain dehydrogenase n=1 Tax=Kutzneria albida DSM 43870 TaxID=1449976 RepID=W5W051_9PSEU|nr:SDR family oxidoreductase [Kutzneria albida]AHH94578.1 short chain dehydrogenase [Kutzneria albida DSM 43870]
MSLFRRYPALRPADTIVAITGGARGIGLATARAFSRVGAKVAIGDLDGPAGIAALTELGRSARAFAVDVASRQSFADFLNQVSNELGAVDVLVNNAGIMPSGAFLAEPEAITRTQVQVNLLGPIHGMQLAVPGMVTRGRGHVVNIASMAGKLPIPGLAVYCGTKFGVVGLSSAVRAELAGSGVSVSAVLPSAVRTELASGFDLGAGMPTVDPEDVAAAVVRTLRTRAAEVSVPGWVRPVGPLAALTPEPVLRLAHRLLNSGRALTPDTAARAAYVQRITEQAADR